MRPGTGVLQEDPNQPPGRGSGLSLKEGVRKPVQVVGRDTQRMIRPEGADALPRAAWGVSGLPWGRRHRGRGPIPLGGEFPSGSSFSCNGPEGAGGPLFPGTPAPPSPPSFWPGSSGRKWAEPRPWQDPNERAQGPGNASSYMYLVHTWPQCKPTHLSRVHVHGLSPIPKPCFPAFLVCAHVCMRVF